LSESGLEAGTVCQSCEAGMAGGRDGGEKVIVGGVEQVSDGRDVVAAVPEPFDSGVDPGGAKGAIAPPHPQ